MRRTALAITLAAALLGPMAAFAAPTCRDQTGMTMKCGAPGAMPVGWTLPPDTPVKHDGSGLGEMDPEDLFSLIGIVGGLFLLIALLPDFDGARGDGWDRQEDDPKPR